MNLHLYNTLTRRKEEFKPLDAKNVRMYVCGPTVYDRPHLGNARSVVVYDVLYRLLNHLYGKEHVTYVRNVTDVDDKINAAAKANKEPISALTKRVEGWFHDDMTALNCELPSREPHATQHITQMIAMIEKLIAGGHAYVAKNHVLFAVASYDEYGALSGRKLDELVAGARVEVEAYKKHPGDFVLWKPAEAGDDPSSVFDSPWGKGRPGWHIECSAMSTEYLGKDFDIHGGGADLMFPHHENEIAQSRCALSGSHFARYWVHNGFLTVNGEKMSKSLGNFVTVKDLLDKGVKGEVIRLALLSSKYNEPLDWNEKLVHDAKLTLDKWYRVIPAKAGIQTAPIRDDFLETLSDDLNLPKAIGLMHGAKPQELLGMGLMLGLFHYSSEQWFKGDSKVDYKSLLGGQSIIELIASQHKTTKEEFEKSNLSQADLLPAVLKIATAAFNKFSEGKKGEILGASIEAAEEAFKTIKCNISDSSRIVFATIFSNKALEFFDNALTVESLINSRIAAKRAKNFAEADRIRKELADQGIILEDRPDGTTDWRRA